MGTGHSQGIGGSTPAAHHPLVAGACLTSRWERVKMTGSMRKTRLDSLLMEAAMTCELTTRAGLGAPASPLSLTVAFSVERKKPRLL
uniref:Uncharacterized protein n=1 Tax=Chrysemys picta bellii TaxID=8478 RepID=A0A8C3P2A6_CHRPI